MEEREWASLRERENGGGEVEGDGEKERDQEWGIWRGERERVTERE